MIILFISNADVSRKKIEFVIESIFKLASMLPTKDPATLLPIQAKNLFNESAMSLSCTYVMSLNIIDFIDDFF